MNSWQSNEMQKTKLILFSLGGSYHLSGSPCWKTKRLLKGNPLCKLVCKSVCKWATYGPFSLLFLGCILTRWFWTFQAVWNVWGYWKWISLALKKSNWSSNSTSNDENPDVGTATTCCLASTYANLCKLTYPSGIWKKELCWAEDRLCQSSR